MGGGSGNEKNFSDYTVIYGLVDTLETPILLDRLQDPVGVSGHSGVDGRNFGVAGGGPEAHNSDLKSNMESFKENNGPFPASFFLYFFFFYKHLTENNCPIKVADD